MLLTPLLAAALAADPSAYERHEVLIAAPEPVAPRGPAGLFDVELVDADLATVFRFLAEAGSLNFVIDDTVKGTVDLHLRGVSWDDALNAVLAQQGLGLAPVSATTWVVTTTPGAARATPPPPR